MSSFTDALIIMAVPKPVSGLARLVPPGFQRPKWTVARSFSYAVGSLDNPSEIIEVPAGFPFDGASVPWLLRLYFPMAHPNYIQAAALHDRMLALKIYSRAHCDAVFHEALGVLGMPDLWRAVLYGGVRAGAARSAALHHLKGLFHEPLGPKH